MKKATFLVCVNVCVCVCTFVPTFVYICSDLKIAFVFKDGTSIAYYKRSA